MLTFCWSSGSSQDETRLFDTLHYATLVPIKADIICCQSLALPCRNLSSSFNNPSTDACSVIMHVRSTCGVQAHVCTVQITFLMCLYLCPFTLTSNWTFPVHIINQINASVQNRVAVNFSIKKKKKSVLHSKQWGWEKVIQKAPPLIKCLQVKFWKSAMCLLGCELPATQNQSGAYDSGRGDHTLAPPVANEWN